MKPIFLVSVITILANTLLSQVPIDKSVANTFTGRTPCQELATLLGEETTPECIKIKWRLTLFSDPAGNPVSYDIRGINYKNSKTRTGQWHILKGTKANPDAIVYQLDYENGKALLLQKADNNVLFFLDSEKNLMVGNRDFSYTLNRSIKQ